MESSGDAVTHGRNRNFLNGRWMQVWVGLDLRRWESLFLMVKIFPGKYENLRSNLRYLETRAKFQYAHISVTRYPAK